MSSPSDKGPSGVRRRLVPPLVAVLVLAVLLGGGYLLRDRPQDAASGSGSPTVLRLDGYQRPAAPSVADDLFRLATDLPDGPSHAAVRWLNSPDRAQIERLANALGMGARVSSAGGASTYTTDTATLRVQRGPGGQWQYARGAFPGGILACPRLPGPTPPGTDPGSHVTCDAAVPIPLGHDAPMTGPAPRTGSVLGSLGVSPADARATARPVLAAVGIDPDAATVPPGQNVVVADPAVADLATQGLTTTVRVSGSKIDSAGGYLSGSHAGPIYPVISAHAAWQQLVRRPLARPLIACREPRSTGNDPMMCGGPITVTGARFGLSLHEVDGRPLLAPSWLFDVRDSSAPLSVVAVDPRYLAGPPVATAGGSVPGSSGSGSSGSGGATGTLVPPVAPSPAPAGPGRDSRFSSVTADGTGLVVQFTGGVSACFSYTVVPTETNRRVALSLVEKTSSNARCVDLAQVYERRVPLAEPLGTRQVVDARTGAVLLPARP